MATVYTPKDSREPTMPNSNSKARRICYDRHLPGERNVPHVLQVGAARPRSIAPLRKQWVNGSVLNIMFMQGSAAQQKMVRDIAPQWTNHANLRFVFTDDPLTAQVRIAFDPNEGAWSYVGLDSQEIGKQSPTMNLGWVDEAVILHEFGHMIGLGHEHQNPAGGIVWNEAQVIADLAGPPNFWDEATTRHNVLDKYAADQINGTVFDPASIMLYAFPGDWTMNMAQGTTENTKLSAIDKAFVASSMMYPRTNTPPEIAAIELPVWTPLAGSIKSPGEENLYKFTVPAQGTYTIETEGITDVTVTLFGPKIPTLFVAKDDDGGEGRNSRIRAALQPGVYYLSIRHYLPTHTGGYTVKILRAR